MDSRELHILLSAYLTALFEPVLHNYQQEDAYRFLDAIEAFFLPGWKQLLGVYPHDTGKHRLFPNRV